LALLAGVDVTALLQSSTATTLMITSFAGRGLVDLVPALAIVLGANIGTTLIVQDLSFNVSAVAPVLFLVGVAAFKVGQRTSTRDLGRVAIGLGLMLLALHILLDTLAPAENAPSVRALLEAITGEPVLCVLIAAALTWAAHSSAAVVLLVMPLAYSSARPRCQPGKCDQSWAAGERSEYCCRNRLGVDQRRVAKERGEQRKEHQLTYSGVHALMLTRRPDGRQGRAHDAP
jgi:hypothetical protein